MSNPFAVLADLIYPSVTQLVGALAPMFGTGAGAIAIVLVTVGVRLALVPVAYAQHRGERRRNGLLAQVAELRRTHEGDQERLDAALSDLYRAHGGGMLAGCLPALVQVPFFAGLYHLFLSPTLHGHANMLLQQGLFGVPLGVQLIAATGPQIVVFAVVIALLVAIGYVSSRLARAATTATGHGADAAPGGHAVAFFVKVVPYATAVVAAFVPLGAGLYLVTSTAWTLAQTAALRSL